MIRPDIPLIAPTSEIELLIFLLDSSTSMAYTNTFDGKTKSYHLFFLVKSLLNRLFKSTKNPAFRVSFIYFSDIVRIIKYREESYFTIQHALKKIKEPHDVIPGGATAIGSALEVAEKIMTIFMEDENFPDDKSATIFLFTDGRENIISREKLIQKANIIKIHPTAPSVATISLGIDADIQLLIEIASTPNAQQMRYIDLAGLSEFLKYKNKLFIEGHVGDNLTKQRIEILRNFVETLSMTR